MVLNLQGAALAVLQLVACLHSKLLLYALSLVLPWGTTLCKAICSFAGLCLPTQQALPMHADLPEVTGTPGWHHVCSIRLPAVSLACTASPHLQI